MAKKTGARIPEQNKIRKLAKEGLTAEEISDQLRIKLSTVRSFIDYDPKAKKKEEPKLSEDEKIAIQELADDNSAEEIAETLELDISLVEAFLEAEE